MNTLQREYLHVPLYAWLAGGAALVLSVLYFMRRGATGTAAATTGAATGAVLQGYPQNVYADTTTYNNSTTPGAGTTSPAPTQPNFLSWYSTNSARLKGASQANLFGEYIKEAGKWDAFTQWLKGQPTKGVPMGSLYGEYIKESGAGPLAQGGGGLNAGAYTAGGGFGSPMLPFPINDNAPWKPRMNSDIFGPATDGTSPVTPAVIWNMMPTAAYTQA